MLCSTIIVAAGEGCPVDIWHEIGRACGAAVLPVESDDQIVELMERDSPECAVVLWVSELTEDKLHLAEVIRGIDRSCPVIALTSPVSAETAVLALRAGFSDILDRNAPAGAIVASLRRLFARRDAFPGPQNDRAALRGSHRLAGQCAAMTGIRGQIARVAGNDANVLITGESGTGKELVAELIHQNSRRRSAPFVAVNCAAIPDALLESELFGYERGAFTGAAVAREGKLQHADGGTLFLDEVGDMSLVSQAKILRAVESRVIQRLGSNVDTAVRFRIVAATNQDLPALIREKKFRQDLYFRLDVVRLNLPPLRDRCEDIPELARQIICELSERQGEPVRRLESDVIRRLQRHTWPGNVRELRNVLESILVYSSSRSIGLADVPAHIRQTLFSCAPRADERSKILSTLNSANWNRNKAAALLGCSRMTLYRKMVKYSVTAREV